MLEGLEARILIAQSNVAKNIDRNLSDFYKHKACNLAYMYGFNSADFLESHPMPFLLEDDDDLRASVNQGFYKQMNINNTPSEYIYADA